MLLFAIESGDLTYSADSVNISTITDKLLLFTRHYSARCFGMNMPKSRDIQAKMPSPQVIFNAFWLVTVKVLNSYDNFISLT